MERDIPLHNRDMRSHTRLMGHGLLALACLILMPLFLAGQATWQENNKAGEKLFQEGKLSDANRLFLDALQEAQRFGANDLRLAPIYNNLALVAFVRNSFINSEALYEKAIAIVESNRGPEDPLLLPILENLARLHIKEWDFPNAIRTTRRICSIREKTFGPENPETISSLNQLATLYLESVRLLPNSQVPASAANTAGNAPGSATPSNDLTGPTALDDATKLDMAESLFRRVLAAQEKSFGTSSNRLVDVLQNLGEVQHAEGKSSQAEKSYSRAAAIIEQSFGKSDQKLAGPLQHLADLKAEQRLYPEAAELYERALQIRQATSSESDPALVPLLTGYSAVMEKLQKPEEARGLSERASTLVSSRKADVLRISEQAGAAPYLIRFEKAVYDRYAGVHQTCLLVREDGRVHIEDQHRAEGRGPISNQIQRSPDGMGDTPATQETLSTGGGSTQHVKTFDSTVDHDSLQQLSAILSANELRKIEGNYSAAASAGYYGTEKIAVSVLRDEGVQSFAFPDLPSRQPYEEALKPLFKWLSNAEKHKGEALKQVNPTNCVPDPPPTLPSQFGPSRQALRAQASSSSPDRARHEAPVEPASSNTPPTIKVAVNLVLVRVVVRDSQGHPVGNLRREDFLLLDNRKPRAITRFTVEQSASEPADTAADGSSTGSRVPSSAPAATERSIAYLFDDAHLTAQSIAVLESAADRQISSLPPSVQAAIFTTSGQTTLDFTADHSKLRQALARIRPRMTADAQGNNCPEIDAYLADLIWNKHDEDALGAATENALICAYGNDARFAAAAEGLARSAAQQRFVAAEDEDRIFLGALRGALAKLAIAPGQRSLVLVSPGFITAGGEQDYARLTEGALRTDITISALDARGLYNFDSLSTRTQGIAAYQHEAASAASELMTTLAEATGGTVFHNNNDFNTGFDRVAATPDSSYLLGFSPTEHELDGRFHPINVTVGGKDQKLSVQARKGYYAIAPGK